MSFRCCYTGINVGNTIGAHLAEMLVLLLLASNLLVVVSKYWEVCFIVICIEKSI